MYGIDETKKEIEDKIEDYFELIGVQKILLGGKSHHFIDLCSQLKFQKRWSRTPRIPQTSVLGHMLVVAILAYLLTGELVRTPCAGRLYNNFFSALFHDLPEVYTRDIISPIKREVPGLGAVIEEYERKKVEEKVLPLLPESWHMEIIYFLDNQFENRVMEKGRVKIVPEIDDSLNLDMLSPVDGDMVRVADELAAFWEAGLSLAHGIRSPNLTQAVSDLEKKYSGRKSLSSLFASSAFDRPASL
jgi:putative hydrolase of HD superfamily